MKICIKKIFIILFIVLFCGCTSKSVSTEPESIVETPPEPKEYSFSMIMAGDSLIHSAVYANAYNGTTYDFTGMLSSIKPIVEKYDLAFINQETIIGGSNLGYSSYPRFNSPDQIGDALIDVGFDIFNLANNHTLDKGEAGMLYSLSYWDTKDVITVGMNASFEERDTIPIYEKNGITYAILGYTTVTNGLRVPTGKEYYLNIYDSERVATDIAKVRDKVDVVMVSMHYGTEYTHTPTFEQTEIANYLASLDVDIVIGHHPHVIQPITYIDDTLVIYSLGNFLSGQIGINKQIGMLASLEVHKVVDGDNIEVTIENVRGDLIYTHYNYYNGRYSNYYVYPFNELNDNILSNYKTYEVEYGNIIGEYNSDILVNTYNWG